MRARQKAFDQLFGRTVECLDCGQEFALDAGNYRGVAMRERVQVEAVRFACPWCGSEQAVPAEPDRSD
jgi:transcription elongation factor Elf1